MLTDDVQASAREQQLNEVLAAYLRGVEAGQPPDREEILARHPDLASDLDSFFANRDQIEQWARPLRGVAPSVPTPVPPASPPTLGPCENAGSAAAPARVGYFGDYELEEKMAQGGMGVIYRARQVSLNRTVALKMILAGQLASAADVQRFQSEAQAVANLDHPHIVPIYEVGDYQGQHYFSMKLIERGSLDQHLTRFRKDIRAGVRLLARVARAVHYAHQHGILHRDLKPANILIDGHDEPHVTDFGLAKRLPGEPGAPASGALTQSGAIVGTPSYMAPEQAAARKGMLTTAVDTYSLGTILYELLTGRPPFRAETPLETLRQLLEQEPRRPATLNLDVDRDLETICLKCLEKEPGRRYGSAEALAEDLERWLAGEPILARRSSSWERARKWAKRRPAVAALLSSVVLVSFLGLGGVTWQWQRAQAAGAEATARARKEEAARRKAEKAQQAEAQARRQAIAERDAKDVALTRAEGMRLTAQSSAVLPSNPGLALLLAIEGAQRGPRRAAHNNALLAALNACRERRTLIGHKEEVRFASFSPDCRRILTGSGDRTRVWDAATGRLLVVLRVPYLRVASASFSPDGRRVLTTFEDNALLRYRDGAKVLMTDRAARLWDAVTGKEVAVLKGHTDRIVSARFSPDGKQVVTGSWDRTARLWDAATGKPLRVLTGHAYSVLSVSFSPDSKRVLAFSSISLPRSTLPEVGKLPPRAVDPPIRPETPQAGEHILGGHGSRAGGSLYQRITFGRVWEVRTGKEVATLKKGLAGMFKEMGIHQASTTFSPDGRRVLTVFTNQTASIWDAKTGKELFSLMSPLNSGSSLPVGGFGGSLSSPARSGGKGGKAITSYRAEDVGRGIYPGKGPIFAATFSPDGRRVLSVSGVTARVWDAATGDEAAILKGHEGWIRDADFSPDGRRVVTASEDQTVRVWDAATGKVRIVLRGHEDRVEAARFSPDGRQVVTASADKTARIWDVAPREEFAIPLTGHRRGVGSAAWSQDGRQVVTASVDRTARTWDALTGKPLHVLKGHAYLGQSSLRDKILGEIRMASLSPDGKQVLTVSADRNARIRNIPLFGSPGKDEVVPFSPVRVWDARTGKQRFALEGLAEGVRSATFSPDGGRILTASDGQVTSYLFRVSLLSSGMSGRGDSGKDNTARVWDATTGKLLVVLRGTWQKLHGATWSPDGRRVATVHDSGIARIWNAATGKQLLVLKRTSGSITSAAFSPDGRRLVTFNDSRISRKSNQDKAAHIWDARTGKPLAALQGDRAEVNWAAFSPDSRWVVTTAEEPDTHLTGDRLTGFDGRWVDTTYRDSTARLWDAATGKLHAVLRGHQRAVHSAAFSPDGRWVVTVSEDRTARIWEVASGKEYFTLRGHQDAVTSAVFSPDSRRVLTTSWDGTACIWPINPMPAAVARKPRELTTEEKERFEVGKPQS